MGRFKRYALLKLKRRERLVITTFSRSAMQFANASALVKSARGLAQSRTLREAQRSKIARQRLGLRQPSAAFWVNAALLGGFAAFDDVAEMSLRRHAFETRTGLNAYVTNEGLGAAGDSGAQGETPGP